MTTYSTEISECRIGGMVWSRDIEAASPCEAVAAAIRAAFHGVRSTGFHCEKASQYGDLTTYHGYAVKSQQEADVVVSGKIRCDVTTKSTCPLLKVSGNGRKINVSRNCRDRSSNRNR